MRKIIVSLLLIFLCVSCGSGGGGNSGSQKETLPTASNNDCFGEDTANNIRTFFHTLTHKKMMKGLANYHIGDEDESNGTGEVTVTKKSDSSWLMLTQLCGSLNNCSVHETNIEIKNGCLFFDNVPGKVFLSRDTDLEALITNETSDGKIRKDFHDFSAERSVSIRTSSVVDGFAADSIEFQEQ